MENANMPAMPLPNNIHRDLLESIHHGSIDPIGTGLTKREHFAGQQMAAIQSNLAGTMSDQAGIQWMAEIAVKQADALLAELEATK